jgi:phosphoserine aminotransferase
MNKPSRKPSNPRFSSGPCTKRPGWTTDVLKDAYIGRSHRAKGPLASIQEMLALSHELLELPEDWIVATVPASDTGAMEMAMWSMLGARGVDFLTWENFGEQWVIDGERQLKPLDARIRRVPYGALPDLDETDPERDLVFVWNGTTSGVRVPNADWISPSRAGVTICDATSAVFAYDMDWRKLDATTYSWQKVMGGEAGFGMLILSPHAIERLESHTPPWPVPKLFRLTKGGKLNKGIFRGETINTISMLAVADALDALRWIESVGGQGGMIARATENARVIDDWVADNDWITHLAAEPETRSRTSMCLSITDPWFEGLNTEARWDVVGEMTKRLEAEDVAYDIKTHRAAPPGLRIWAGGTVESADLEALTPWLDWAWEQTRNAQSG